MGKALLVKGGKPNPLEDRDKFMKNEERDIKLMSSIASHLDYSIKSVNLENMLDEINLIGRSIGSEEDFLFYYTGHSNADVIGDYNYKFSDLFGHINQKIKGRKFIILDSCAAHPKDSEKTIFNNSGLKFPTNSRVYGVSESYPSHSLSKLFYDAVFSYRKNLEDIDQEYFLGRTHGFVKVRDTD